MTNEKFKSMRPSTLIGGVLLLICGINLHTGVKVNQDTENYNRVKRSVLEPDQHVSVIHEEKQSNGSRPCVKLHKESIQQFKTWVTKEEMTFISFNLSFTSRVNASHDLFFPYEWTWTYSGMEEASFTMIKFPFDFDLLSCGLLSKHVKRFRGMFDEEDDNVRVVINVTLNHDCQLMLGHNDTDVRMQVALQQLIAQTKYANNSMFCYEVMYNVSERMGNVWYYMTHFFGVQREYTGYKCCPSPHKSVGCDISVKQTPYLWIIQMYGVIIAIFFPLMLRFIPENLSDRNRQLFEGGRNGRDEDMEPFADASELPEIPHEEWVYLGDGAFSFYGILKWICLSNNPSMLVKRIRRIVFIHLSLVIILIRTLLYYIVKKVNVKARIDNSIPIGHLCIPFGFQACASNTFYFLGSPIIYLPLYLFFGSILLCIPKDIPLLFLSSTELSDQTHLPVRTFLYITDGALECRKIVRNHNHLSGYQKFATKMQDRFSMLITKRFWKFFFKVWRRRFRLLNCVSYCSYASPRGYHRYILIATAILPTILSWAILAAFCLLEIFLVICYYGCPIVFFLKLSFSGFLSLIFQASSINLSSQDRRCWVYSPLWGFASVIFFTVLFSVFFVGIFQFAVSFTFLLHIVSFTFVGMVVYPEIALTYVLAALAILYYVIRSFSAITDGYIMLLRVMVNVSQALADEGWRPTDYEFLDDEYRYSFLKENPATGMLGVPKEAFDDVIETVRPVRMQIIGAFVKLFITANIIYSSVTLIQSFHEGQYVSLPARTIAVIFVGFLPELFGIFQSKFQETVQEEKFEKYINVLVKKFWYNRFQLTTTEAIA